MEEPTEEDCCRSDCTNCILDFYKKQQKVRIHSVLRPTNSIMSQTIYKPFSLVKIHKETSNVNVYSFVPDDDDGSRMYFMAGEHVILRNEPTNSEMEHISRPYTLIPWDTGGFSVMIKLYSEGKMSQYIKGLNVGHKSYWRGPYGDFTYEPNKYKYIYMICIGTGIAPMYAISKQIIDNEDDETVIHLLYGSTTPDDIIFRKQINELNNYWNFNCTHYISQSYHENQKKLNETFVNGKITREVAKRTVKHTNGTLVLVCGSIEFNSVMQDSLKDSPDIDIHVFS